MNSSLFSHALSASKDILKGGIIGVANIIPGVSGGTMAVVLGLYDRLIDILCRFNGKHIKALLNALKNYDKGELKKITEELDLLFLFKLGFGAALAIVAFSKIIGYLLVDQHDPTYGFFFGLILLSIVVPYKAIEKKGGIQACALILGLALPVGLESLMNDKEMIENAELKQQVKSQKQNTSLETSQNKEITLPHQNSFRIFLTGALAISAMILPGISGSFILVLLGSYFYILQAINQLQFGTLFFFGLGCASGLLLFVRLIRYILARYASTTFAFLMGLMAGSLWNIWPFKNSALVGNQMIYLSNKWPMEFGSNELLTLISALVGAILVGAMIKYEPKK